MSGFREYWRELQARIVKLLGLEEGQRVYLSAGHAYIYLTQDTAYLNTVQIGDGQSVAFTPAEMRKLVSSALQACEEKELRVVQVRDLSWKIDARVMHGHANRMKYSLGGRIRWYAYLVDRAYFEAGLKDVSARLAAMLGQNMKGEGTDA